jgi:DNA modification methylase
MTHLPKNPFPRKRQRRKSPKAVTDPGCLCITYRDLRDLRPYDANARRHDDKHVAILARAIDTFGFTVPVMIDQNSEIIAGHGRFEAALKLGMHSIPTVMIDHLTPAQVRALRIADNRLAEISSWDDETLKIELTDLAILDLDGKLEFDLDVIGFDTAQLDIIITDPALTENEPEDNVQPDFQMPPVSALGDIWQLGRHRLMCGSSLDRLVLEQIAEDPVRMVFIDPPYNVPVQGHVRGGEGHREFAMASGEMSAADFKQFLATAMETTCRPLMPGGIAMVCMDWRHIEEIISVGKALGLDLINLCVWNKTNGGMGSLYRSKHELVCVFRKPGEKSVNNVELGKHGRYRTNVWDYAGVNTFRLGRAEDLADHPTIKPTAMVADAIRDVSHRGDLILDTFGGSGTTLLAAERTGRRARLVEIDPIYADLIIRRWQDMTGEDAYLERTEKTFEQMHEERLATAPKMEQVDVG